MLLAACSSPVVDVDITADGCPIALADRMSVEAFDGEGRLVREVDVPAPSFPSGVRLVRDSASATWRVRATLYDQNDVAISVIEATGDFSEASAALHFEDRCLGVICSEGESCVGGACGRPDAPRSEPLAQCPAWLFVSTEGTDDAMCGAFATPCRSVAHLVQRGTVTAAAGAVINVAGGVYGQSFLLESHYQGPMVVRGWPDTGRPIFRMTGEYGVWIWANDVTIQDLDVEDANHQGIRHNASGEQSNLRIRRCHLRGNGTDAMEQAASGVMVQSVDNFDIEDCTFDGHPNRAIWVGNESGNGRLRRNRLTNNDDGIFVRDGSHDIELTDNVLLTGSRGIIIEGSEPVRIEHNRVCGHVTAVAPGGRRLSVDRNTFIGNATGLGGGNVGEQTAFDGNIFVGHTSAAIALTDGATPTEGRNLFYENEVDHLGFESRGENIEGNPGVVDASECSLERTSDAFAEFGAR